MIEQKDLSLNSTHVYGLSRNESFGKDSNENEDQNFLD